MPAIRCSNGKWKWGERGKCVFDSKEDAERAGTAIHAGENEGADKEPRRIMPTFEHIKVLPFMLEKAEPSEHEGRKRLHISGWASTETPDRAEEVIDVGFFDVSLPDFMRTAAMPWMHDTSDPQGKWEAITPVPGKGYHVSGYLVDLGTDLDKRRMAMVEEGLVRSLSVGFNAEYHADFGAVNEETKLWHWRTKGKLLEVSPCTIPCCPDADFAVAKALGIPLLRYDPKPKDEAEEDRFLADLERVMGGVESIRNIHRHWQKAGRVLSSANMTRLEQCHELLGSVLAEANPPPAEEPGKQGGLSLPRVDVLTLPLLQQVAPPPL